MKIKYGMILAAGLGKRMQPITLETPKPLIKLGNKNLLERAIELLIDFGVEEISINVHHLADQIKKFIDNNNYKIKFTISDEKDTLLDTGGGILKGTKLFKESPFIVINPDTLWRKDYLDEIKNLEKLYYKEKKPCLLVVHKKLSFDKSFKGDFNIKNNLISRDKSNEFIFTGLQILNRSAFSSVKSKIFSMNDVWNHLINSNYLIAYESKQNFYHINTKKMYDKILKFNTIY